MAREERVVKMYTREEMTGVTTGHGIALEIDGVEIPGVVSIQPHEINADDLVMITLTLCVRLGK